ncbi:glucose oxidase [Marssonina coronariae]|uniref:Glucose oxidase n=1 Tax=Diplocarpon coronariae TaxID=2795749 RepID=A0A218Z7G5_9HELO|nr:glucose oxidase [Marssonina coronariae]
MSPSLISLVPFLSLLATTHGLPTTGLTYDYVIVGAGTSGLAVANRLSELPNITVAVIEAGDSVLNNANVSSIGGYSLAFGTDIDYAYQTVNQTYANGAAQTLRAGKAIGGTSTINGMSYTRAEDVQLDAWEELGNSGWNWKSLLPYYIKSEQFQTPANWQIATGITYDPEVHGFRGPLKVGFANSISNSTIAGTTLNQTYAHLGQPWNHDVNDGKMRGLTSNPSTVDQAGNVREDAARAYYWPFENRNNLVMHSNTVANRILWKETGGLSGAVAGGVEITSANGTIGTIFASKEVILSAGAIRSSGILELSGIGNPDILEPLGIQVVVDLPTVGENLQDQVNNEISYSGNSSFAGSSSLVAYPNAGDIYGGNLSSLAEAVSAKIPSYAATVANASNHVVSEADLLKFFNIQYDLIFKSNIPILEIFNSVGASYVSLQFWSLLPFSRGNIHIKSADPREALTINPNFFMLDFDLNMQVESARFIRNTLAKAEPLAAIISGESSPGLSVLAEDADEAAFGQWIKDSYRSNFHPVGTTAMMARDIGGVVSDRLVVYGTENVRVVDAGILPFQLCGHLTSTLYAVAEKAADMIKEDA